MTNNLKDLRKKKHITLDMMSVRSTIPSAEYIQIEKGQKEPTDVQLRQIAVALGVDVNEIR